MYELWIRVAIARGEKQKVSFVSSHVGGNEISQMAASRVKIGKATCFTWLEY